MLNVRVKAMRLKIRIFGNLKAILKPYVSIFLDVLTILHDHGCINGLLKSRNYVFLQLGYV